MHTDQRVKPQRRILWGLVVCAIGLLGIVSCNYPGPPIFEQSELDQGWPESGFSWRPKTSLPANWAEGKQLWRPKEYSALRAELPQVADAEFVGLDAQCVLCHEAYVTAFSNNVHRSQGCERCHGAASRHIETQGLGPESILLLRETQEPVPTARLTNPIERAEVCLQCHDTNLDPAQPLARDREPLGPQWRTSAHAHQAMSCNDCHVAHYNVPPGTPATVVGKMRNDPHVRQTSNVQPPAGQDSLRGTSRNLGAITPDSCYRCHRELKRFEEAIHPHQIGSPIWKPSEGPGPGSGHYGTFDCTTCHDPHGNVLPATRKDLCLQCHDGPHMDQWHGSQHDLAGIGCTDCHTPHPESGRSMAVNQPQACYRCHSETQQLELIAGPHQLLGPNNFNCSTCHDPHGRVTSLTRTDQCLSCHSSSSPTMAWHTSFHSREGVACADCHDAHPNSRVQQLVGIRHTNIRRANRRPMSVNEPATCYRCHPKVFSEASMPSHHPIREGKVVCSDCHAGHGQGNGSLKAETLNQLCFECHAEKEGPFVWEHAPVTEDCSYCHAPHGAVANNLLHQPPTFLCLRCHTGHSTHGGSPQCERCHFVEDEFVLVGGGPKDPSVPTTASLRRALFTDCTQCHTQVHGSDNPSGFECGCGMRR